MSALGLASLVLACAPATLRVMVFNVEYGGDLVDFAKTIEAIQRAEPDLVLIEEAWGHIPRLAAALGWPEHDIRHQVAYRLFLFEDDAYEPLANAAFTVN